MISARSIGASANGKLGAAASALAFLGLTQTRGVVTSKDEGDNGGVEQVSDNAAGFSEAAGGLLAGGECELFAQGGCCRRD